jgi:dihydropyrimidine dehydrogenase (NAD+) subunit PreT
MKQITLSAKLPAAVVAENMAELHPAYTPQEAAVEASRCLFCFDAPCIMACPTGIDIPSFIKKIETENIIGAARTILSANILGASCARVCPTEVLCEGACVMVDRQRDPIKIGRLQRFATDYVYDRGLDVLQSPRQKTGKRIAVIGAGPAGVGCAAELAQLGHGVVIFERKPLPGGLNTYGIAYYKMKPEISLAEMAMVERLGVEFRCGIDVGRHISAARLQQEYDAVFIGIGLGEGQALRIPGEELHGVYDALDFIEEIHSKPPHEVAVGNSVIVIGCGNTAIDAITQAKRLGAQKGVVAYRRSEAEMSAYDFEYELAQRDGATFYFNVAPLELIGDETGQVCAVKFVRTETGSDGELRLIPGSEFTEPAEMVLKAVGQSKQAAWLAENFPALRLDQSGVVERNPATGQTSVAHLFAGGDCANGGREVVNAVGEGKKAAHGIHAFLGGLDIPAPRQPSRLGVNGDPGGSGLEAPIRAHELEKLYYSREAKQHG